MKELTLINGTKVNINTKLTPWGLIQAQDEGLISKDFLAKLASLSNAKKEDMQAIMQNIPQTDIMYAPYLAYKNANKDGMNKEEFLSSIYVDYGLFAEIYMDIVVGNMDHEKQMSQGFQKATGAKKKGNQRRSYQK